MSFATNKIIMDDISPNTSHMERVAADAERAARTGSDKYPMQEESIEHPSAPSFPSAGNDAADENEMGGFQVYNPVDETYDSWGENGKSGGNIHGDSTPDTEQSIDLNDPELIASQREQLAALEASKRDSVDDVDKKSEMDDDDDALAQAIAEQDLPPGVSAVEQQEIMMRLLTQQLRRGDWANDEDLSPALEQRLRDFQFAQRKRRETYGNERPWGILGLYDHLGECSAVKNI